MTVASLGYVVIETRDLASWSTFATEVVGLMPAPSAQPDVLLFRMDDRPFRFWIQQGDREAFVQPGWELANAGDFNAAVERLKSAGRPVQLATPAEARARQVTALARSSDPAGNDLEIYYGRVLDYAPFRSPAGVSRFVTGPSGELGLGHVVLSAPNFAETHAFYKSVLGFGDTDLGHFYLAGGSPDDPGVRFAFMHARNQRHHSLALGELPQNEARLVHLMVEVASVDDVGRAYERVHKQAVPVSATLGRHVNDKMLSFYMRTPGGFDIEYGCDGLLIDPATWIPTTSLPVSDWGHVWAFQNADNQGSEG
ncbi:3,4-dihydroxy-9,10-secoandrosta-1,3,5(10)-triene-9,17-dione 4,5-dioxygenase [Nitrospirillum amazonense]|uniref:3,4-dihydroxy-9,10-secoandrosta-1,3, 5(10)-triene-9,17-dione 4,5-dioxygenase n=2 Tax=Nitrospirillum amazonense TaxID=28077 RepID=A0A560J9V1_9PROT|nr:VOC family protein [Nitrospirillum amazonense]TWB18395.1 3,4-dihydroxy-9,10-secoandrosta-1,3,5(10)-triene-9,17-dione 4,5-dioxygenase [Nitrospirillum amazonense]TWB66084.1 3,4-dihydroxy-9,10-secoandrosta-1,3,5(10)-triene-9,17-dione 4,5-dioxygenase [Nitrospirillum amazonense]